MTFSENWQRILDLLRDEPIVYSRLLVNRFNWSKDQARQILSRMARAGYIERVQGKKSGVYQLPSKKPSALRLDDFVVAVPYHEGPYKFFWASVPREWVRRLAASVTNQRTGQKQVGFKELGHPCVPPETIVAGDYKPIVEYSLNDLCLGLHGVGNVTETFGRQYSGELLEVKAAGILPMKITPDHPMLVATRWYRRQTETMPHKVFSKPYWKPAKNLVTCRREKRGDHLAIPRVAGWIRTQRLDIGRFAKWHGRKVAEGHGKPTVLELSTRTAWVLGLYVAEGSSSSQQVQFSLGSHETALQTRLLGSLCSLGYRGWVKPMSKNAVCICVGSRLLARALPRWCGRLAHNKRIPDFILYHKNLDILHSFLEGYVMGDGCIKHPSNQVWNRAARQTAVTTSKVLALQLQLLAARLGFLLSINERGQSTGVIEGRRIVRRASYHLQYPLDPTKTWAKITQAHVLTPILQVKPIPYNGTVCNLATTDETYVANNILVHNCSAQFEKSGGIRVYPYVQEQVWRPWLERELVRRGWGMDEAHAFNAQLRHSIRQVEIVGPKIPAEIAREMPPVAAVPEAGVVFKVCRTPPPGFNFEVGLDIRQFSQFLGLDSYREAGAHILEATKLLNENMQSHVALVKELRSEASSWRSFAENAAKLLDRLESFLSRLESKQGQSSDGKV